jgi:hypothetical protein
MLGDHQDNETSPGARRIATEPFLMKIDAPRDHCFVSAPCRSSEELRIIPDIGSIQVK